METIFVGDLSYFCSDQDLKQLFQPFGVVKSASVRRSANNESLHYGFVQMKIEDATIAFHNMQGRKVMGRHLKLNMGKMLKIPNLRQHSIQLHVSFICHDTNLTVNEELLGDIFSAFGKVLDCVVKQYTVISEANKQCGYGFVFYEDMSAVNLAITSTKDILLRNIQFDCTLSHDSHNKIRQGLQVNPSSVSPKNEISPSLPSQSNENCSAVNSNANFVSNTVINTISNIPTVDNSTTTANNDSANVAGSMYAGIASYGVPIPPPISTANPYNQSVFQQQQMMSSSSLAYVQPMQTHPPFVQPPNNMSQSPVMVHATNNTANLVSAHSSTGTIIDLTNSPMTDEYSSSHNASLRQPSPYHSSMSHSAIAVTTNNQSSSVSSIQHPTQMMQQMYTYYPAAIPNNMYMTNPPAFHSQHQQTGMPPTLSPPVMTAQLGQVAFTATQNHPHDTMLPSPTANHSFVYSKNSKNTSSNNSNNNSSSATPTASYGYGSSQTGSGANSNNTPKVQNNSYGYSSSNHLQQHLPHGTISNNDLMNNNFMVSQSLPATPPYHHQQHTQHLSAPMMVHHSLSYSNLNQHPTQTHLTSAANNMYFYPTALPPTHPPHSHMNSTNVYYYASSAPSANPSNASTPTNNFNNNYYLHNNTNYPNNTILPSNAANNSSNNPNKSPM